MAVIVCSPAPEEPHDDRNGKDGGVSGARRDASPAAESMADPVTRHAPITGPCDWKYLNCGIDTLDVGFYCNWIVFNDLLDRLDSLKQQAAATRDSRALWEDCPGGSSIVWASGKKPNYAYHVEAPGLHVFIARNREASKSFPNVYVSIASRLLWSVGVRSAIEAAETFIEALGATVVEVKPSRCDIAADFLIPGGIDLDFLRKSKVGKSRTTRAFMEDDAVETFYVGKPKRPVQVRIYDKAAEINAKGDTKLWFLDVWEIEECKDIWRVEFQLRREVLKQFDINSVDELLAHTSAIWRYLTEEWLSFRLDDNSNTARRTVHPWWQHVQNCGDLLGPQSVRTRQLLTNGIAQAEWYIAHVGGCLLGFAVREGIADCLDAMDELLHRVGETWRYRD